MKKTVLTLTLAAALLCGAGIASAATPPSASYHDSIHRAEQQGTRNPRAGQGAPRHDQKQGKEIRRADPDRHDNGRHEGMKKAPSKDGKEMRQAPPARAARPHGEPPHGQPAHREPPHGQPPKEPPHGEPPHHKDTGLTIEVNL